MAALDESRLLDVWEDARARPSVRRPLALLRIASPEASDAELGALRVGEAERRLLALHERLFGPALRGVCECSACGVPLEVHATTTALLAAAPDTGEAEASPVLVSCDGWRVECRPPTGADLAAAADATDAAAAHRALLDRCVVAAWCDGVAAPADHLPAFVVAAVAARMEEADPLGDVRLTLRCADCDAAWAVPFEAAPFLLARLDGWARGVMRAVHVLASAYGWSEAEVLALRPARRRAYLDLVER